MENNTAKKSTVTVVTLGLILVLSDSFYCVRYGIVFAEAQEKINQVDTLVLRGIKKFTCTDDPNIVFNFDIVKYLSAEYGYNEKGYIKDEQIYSITLNLPEKQTIVSFPSLKKALKFPCTDAQLKIMELLSPDGIIELLLRNPHEELGTKDLNGIEVEVFTFEDANTIKGIFPKNIINIEKCKGTLWIGTKILLPVRIEGDFFIGKCLMTANRNLALHEVDTLNKFNVEFNKQIFSTEIPEGFTELKLNDLLPLIQVKSKDTAEYFLH